MKGRLSFADRNAASCEAQKKSLLTEKADLLRQVRCRLQDQVNFWLMIAESGFSPKKVFVCSHRFLALKYPATVWFI